MARGSLAGLPLAVREAHERSLLGLRQSRSRFANGPATDRCLAPGATDVL